MGWRILSNPGSKQSITRSTTGFECSRSKSANDPEWRVAKGNKDNQGRVNCRLMRFQTCPSPAQGPNNKKGSKWRHGWVIWYYGTSYGVRSTEYRVWIIDYGVQKLVITYGVDEFDWKFEHSVSMHALPSSAWHLWSFICRVCAVRLVFLVFLLYLTSTLAVLGFHWPTRWRWKRPLLLLSLYFFSGLSLWWPADELTTWLRMYRWSCVGSTAYGVEKWRTSTTTRYYVDVSQAV